MATTLERESGEVVQPAQGAVRAHRFTTATLAWVGVLTLLVGFGAGWNAFRESGEQVPTEVRDLVDDYRDAWVVRNGKAAVAFMAPGARFHSDYNPAGYSGETLARSINVGVPGFVAEIEIDSVTGDGPYIVVSSAPERTGDYSVVHVGEIDGELKILKHVWFED